MLPKTGIDIAPDAERCVPEMTNCATLVAVGSLTARLPEIVAKGDRLYASPTVAAGASLLETGKINLVGMGR